MMAAMILMVLIILSISLKSVITTVFFCTCLILVVFLLAKEMAEREH